MLNDRRKKRIRRTEGAVVKIPLGAGKAGYGLVLKEPLVAIFDHEADEGKNPDISTLVEGGVAFILMVMNRAITDGRWPVIAHVQVPAHLQKPPAFCKQDQITGELSVYQEIEDLAPHYERAGRPGECQGLETAAVWEPEHIEDRMRDHFAGRSNVWVEQLRVQP